MASSEKTGNATMVDTDGRARTEPAETPEVVSKNGGYLVKVLPPTNEVVFSVDGKEYRVTRVGLQVSKTLADKLLKASGSTQAQVTVEEVK